MNVLTNQTSTTALAAAVQSYKPATGDLRGLMAARRDGIPILPCDMTPKRVDAVKAQLIASERVAVSVTPEVVVGWIGKLAKLVTNPPAIEELPDFAKAIFEVCSDIPLGAWSADSRMAWCRQPDRNGYPVGSRWPAPGELRNVLLPFAEAIKREIADLRALVDVIEKPREQARKKPDAREMRHVSESLAALRADWAQDEESPVHTTPNRDSMRDANAVRHDRP